MTRRPTSSCRTRPDGPAGSASSGAPPLRSSSYAAYGLLEGTPAQILHDVPWRPQDRETGEQLIASRRGTERAVVDSPWQLPGEFVVSPAGVLVHAHRYQYCEDFPPRTVLLGAIAVAR